MPVRHIIFFIFLCAIIVGSYTTQAFASWNVVILHNTEYTSSFTYGVYNSVQSGGMLVSSNIESQWHASIWNGTPDSIVDINPLNCISSYAYGVYNGKQAGYANGLATKYNDHASLWSGSADSWIDLNPAKAIESSAYGIYKDAQVGYIKLNLTGSKNHASLWFGSAISCTDLNPEGFTSSIAYGVFGKFQIGHGYGLVTGNKDHAVLWNSSADYWTDLNPKGSAWSNGFGIYENSQVGSANGEITGYQNHASLWHGSSDSWVDIHPSDCSSSVARGVCKDKQVGYAYGKATGSNKHASIWTSTAESWLDLHKFLPDGYTSSQAYGIYDNGYETWVVGYAAGPEMPGLVSVMWHYITDYKIHGEISYYTGSSSKCSIERDVQLIAVDSLGTVLKSWTVPLVFENDISTKYAKANYNLEDIPYNATDISAKTDWHIRQKRNIEFASGDAVVDFVLLGGDIDNTHDNKINVSDYNVLKTNWFSTNPKADINGDAVVNVLDYNILKTNWFKLGDPI